MKLHWYNVTVKKGIATKTVKTMAKSHAEAKKIVSAFESAKAIKSKAL